jgi:hypothetical protein
LYFNSSRIQRADPINYQLKTIKNEKYIFVVAALLFSALCLNVFGQTKSYPFEVIKKGKGKQAIIFLPGFASSGDVWNETKSNFEKDFTCYTFTMAGFAGVKPQPNASFKIGKQRLSII